MGFLKNFSSLGNGVLKYEVNKPCLKMVRQTYGFSKIIHLKEGD